ncbi:MAG TPA: 3-hydroxyacyl-CoA dehydrogenase NAD-binding domain-containing protein [Burkholderiaceae bacterium]|nr:3-hydroxyacyl-CoA dehydrogenase NAD-binding domain-containing protein [Burkholderiaceae bacterium]
MQQATVGKLAVIGAGNMGNAIASLFGSHGWTVVLIDPSDAACSRSREKLQETAPQYMARFSWSPSLDAAQDASVIIEAAPENATLKQQIFQKLESCCPATTLIATNTSGISINQLATTLAHPERFIGTHFFTPADVIPLVEVVAGDRTDPATSERILTLLRSVGKLPVLVRKDIPGFIANRLQHALAREAMSLLEKGVATAEDIDTVAKWSLGIRLALTGPLEQRDINGLDIHHAIAGYLYPDLENRQTPSQVLSKKVEQGDLGVKTGQGFYEWHTPEQRAALQEKEAALRALVAHLGPHSA